MLKTIKNIKEKFENSFSGNTAGVNGSTSFYVLFSSPKFN